MEETRKGGNAQMHPWSDIAVICSNHVTVYLLFVYKLCFLNQGCVMSAAGRQQEFGQRM
jgi:hypothetical protein